MSNRALTNGAYPNSAQDPALPALRILVVDDNPADRLMYRMLLAHKTKRTSDEERTFEIAEAENCATALVACTSQRPDCIVLDFNLPNMDGLEFMQAMKDEFGELPCPVVMLTGVRDERVAVKAMKMGAADYIPKSDRLGEALELAILSAVEKHEMRGQIEAQRLALAASERRHRTLLEALPQLVWISSVDGFVEYANWRWLEYTGMTPGPTTQLLEVVHPDDRERYGGARRRAVASDSPFEMELRLRRHADQADRWHLIRMVSMTQDETSPKWLGTCTDIDDLKLAERALQQKQKWESIGLLAGGIAHDFNNLLVGILGGASYAADSLSPTHPVQPMLENIVKSGERAAQLTRQMLAYSGQGQFVIERVDLSAAVHETSQLVRALIPSHVRINIETTDKLPLIETDAGQMQQVLMNLIINAAEAIPENQQGKIWIRTSSGEIAPESVPAGFTMPPDRVHDKFVFVDVEDTGCGMDDETKAKIFDPFFTTKFTGRGLGLAAVQGIMRSTGGWITVKSTPGKGSTFRVAVPAIRTAAPPAPVVTVNESPAEPIREGAVLIIDDEEVVRNVVRIALERAGYRVLTANDGMSGLEMLQSHSSLISLVLLDMGMPEMSGKEVLIKLRAVGITTPVVICSGYSEPEVLRQLADCEFTAVIQKPFKTKELPERVQAALRSGKTAAAPR